MTRGPHAPVRSGRGHCDDADLGAVVCHTPLSNLGHCRRGSTLSFTVAFQILKPGLYEVPHRPLPEAVSWRNTSNKNLKDKNVLALVNKYQQNLSWFAKNSGIRLPVIYPK